MNKHPDINLKLLKEIKAENYPFSQDETIKILEKGYYKNPSISFTNIKRFYMNFALSIGVVALGLLTYFNQDFIRTDSVAQLTQEEIIVATQEETSSYDFSALIDEEDNRKTTNIQTSDVITNNPKTSNNSEPVTIMAVPIDPNKEELKDPYEKYRQIPGEGMYILELSKSEFNAIVPNSFINDDTLLVYQEMIYQSESTFDLHNLGSLGYNKDELPVFLTRFSTMVNEEFRCCNYLPNDFREPEEFTKELYVAFTVFDENDNHRISSFYPSLLLKYSENIEYREYYEFKLEIPKLIYELRQNNNIEERDKVDIRRFQTEAKIIADLIPVKTILNDKRTIIFWFYPNDEFIELLPERYRDIVSSEVSIKNRLDANEIDMDNACEELTKGLDLFQLCRKSSGALLSFEAYPNPSTDNIQANILLEQDRTISVKIHDVNGNEIKIIFSKKLKKGAHTLTLDIESIPPGLYMIVVQSDQNEIVSTRLIKGT